LAQLPGRPYKLLEMYLETVMDIFMEKASALPQYDSSRLFDELLEYASLMKVISEQETFQSSFLQEVGTDLVIQFRNFWFYLILYVMNSDGTWPKDWIPIIASLAESTPLLVSKKSQRSLIADLGANSILRGTFSETIVNKIKLCIVSRWPNLHQINDPRLLPFSVQCYIVTVYKIESFRVRNVHSIEFLCHYLTDQRLQVADIQQLLELFMNEVLFI
jgi:hypothetical protein